MANDGWEPQREEARDPAKRQFHFGETNVPGCCTLAVCIPSMPMPLGTVWFRFVGNSTIEILWSYVVDPVRRCGLRTALHETLLSSYPTVRRVMSANGTDDGGRAWLKAMGFQRAAATGDWELSIKRKRVKR